MLLRIVLISRFFAFRARLQSSEAQIFRVSSSWYKDRARLVKDGKGDYEHEDYRYKAERKSAAPG